MTRRVFAFAGALVSLCFLVPALGQQTTQRQSAHLRALVPQDDATLFIDEKPTKQEGLDRHFVSPPLEPCKTFTYAVTAKWWPNNYTEVIRTRRVEVKAGRETLVDLRKPDPKQPDNYLIRFVPTPEDVVDAMCKLAKVGKDDVVYDLGCGDGRIVITAITDFKAKRGVGIDIDPQLVKLSQEEARAAKVADRVTFRQQDVLTMTDLSDATVVMMYMGEDVNLRLMPILKSTLKPGSRIVSHDFPMGDWKPHRKVNMTDWVGEDHVLYLWTIGKDKIPSPKSTEGEDTKKPSIRFHDVPNGSAQRLAKLLQEHYKKTDVRIEAISPSRIFAYGNDTVHREIAKKLQEIDKKGPADQKAKPK